MKFIKFLLKLPLMVILLILLLAITFIKFLDSCIDLNCKDFIRSVKFSNKMLNTAIKELSLGNNVSFMQNTYLKSNKKVIMSIEKNLSIDVHTLKSDKTTICAEKNKR